MEQIETVHRYHLARVHCDTSPAYEEEFLKQLSIRAIFIVDTQLHDSEQAATQLASRPLNDSVRAIGEALRRIAHYCGEFATSDFSAYDQILPSSVLALAGRQLKSAAILFDLIQSLTGGPKIDHGCETFGRDAGIMLTVPFALNEVIENANGQYEIHYRSAIGRAATLDIYTHAMLVYVMELLPRDKRVTYIGGCQLETVVQGLEKVHVCTSAGSSAYSEMMRDEAYLLTTTLGGYYNMAQIRTAENFISNPNLVRCYDAKNCSLHCDVLLIDHTKESISLSLAVAMAVKKGARVVYGWFLGDSNVTFGSRGIFGDTNVSWVATDWLLTIGNHRCTRRTMLLDDFRNLMATSEYMRNFPGVECSIMVNQGAIILYKLVLADGFSLGRSLGGYVSTHDLGKKYAMLDGSKFDPDLFMYCSQVPRPKHRGTW